MTLAVAKYAATSPTARRAGSTGSRLIKWVVIAIIAVVVIALVYMLWSMYSTYGLNPLDPSTWAPSLIELIESKWGVSDTGSSAGGAWWGAAWRASPFGWAGSAIGIGTSSSGRAGLAENYNNIKNNAYTFFRRLSGN